MKTEARKAYEKQMPCSEMLIRREIDRAKRGIKYSKVWLSRYEWSLRSDHTFTSEDVQYVEKCIGRCLRTIKGYKSLIQTLKNGLPQRRPKGVMAKCPFCGAKQNDALTLKNGKGEGVTVKSLYALEDVFDEFMAVGCRNCGARIAYPKYDDTAIQDLIDVWNRRA